MNIRTDANVGGMAVLAPDAQGYFGEYGGPIDDPRIAALLQEISDAFDKCMADPTYTEELMSLRKHYVGRPSPVYHARNLSPEGGAQIYLKREDLNHTGAHKINHCIGEVLLAKRMGKKRVLAETGAASRCRHRSIWHHSASHHRTACSWIGHTGKASTSRGSRQLR